MKKFVLYIHTFPNKKVYVGITCREPNQRWQNGTAYKQNKHLSNAIKKYGWQNIEHKILYANLSKEEACELEIKTIEKYNATNCKYGYNVSLGGGYPSEETKMKISKSHIGIRPNKQAREKMRMAKLGKKQSPETIEKRKMVGAKNPMYGRVVTQEEREHLRNLFKGKKAHPNTVNANKIKIVQYTRNGEFIREYDSIRDASKILNISYQRICHNCNGHQKYVGNYLFRHKAQNETF